MLQLPLIPHCTLVIPHQRTCVVYSSELRLVWLRLLAFRDRVLLTWFAAGWWESNPPDTDLYPPEGISRCTLKYLKSKGGTNPGKEPYNVASSCIKVRNAPVPWV